MPCNEHNKSKEFLSEQWGPQASRVIEECIKASKANKPMGFSDFVKTYCFACGGDWNGMLLSGIKEAFPNVYEVIPDNMGDESLEVFVCLNSVISICGITGN